MPLASNRACCDSPPTVQPNLRGHLRTTLVAVVCAAAVAVSVMVLSRKFSKLTTRGARRVCERWSERLGSRLARLRTSPALESSANAIRTQAGYYAYVLDAVGKRPHALAELRRGLEQAYDDVGLVELGRDPFAARTGVILRGYISPIDAALQPYSIFVPDRYARAPALPLIVSLHGHGWYRRFQGHPAPCVPAALVLSPHGRGSTDYMLAGEIAVLMALADVQQQYRVDANRVYLVGSSMGGTGSWHIATRYPDLVAGIGPTSANADHHVWERLWGWQSRTSGPFARLRRFFADSISPVTFAENLLNVPVFCIHGAEDDVVPVGHARHMVDRVRAAGGQVVYRELPHAGHGAPRSLLDEQLRWLSRHVRNPFPKRVRYKTNRRRYSGAYWVRIEDLCRELEFASVDARVVHDGEIVAATRNVRRLRLLLEQAPLGQGDRLSITIDGQHVLDDARRPKRAACFWFDEDRRSWRLGEGPPLGKTAAVEGPIGHVFMTPFVLVYGTQSADRLEARMVREAAFDLARQWEKRYGKPCRVKADIELTAGEAKLLSLVLYGGPWANTWTAKLIGQLPVEITHQAVTFAGQVYAGDDVGVKLCYPSPLNPRRYVALFAATTWRGMWQINSRFGNWFDWGAYDNYNWFDFGVFDSKTRSPETFRVVGFFDRAWQPTSALTWRGDDALRDERPRFAPPATLPEGESVLLSDWLPALIDQDKGPVGFDATWDGRPIRLGGKRFAKGLGVRAPSAVEFDLDGRFNRFDATVGIDYGGSDGLSSYRVDAEQIEFEVFGDGRLLATSEPMNIGRSVVKLEADVAGVGRLSLKVSCLTGARWLLGGANWADARVSLDTPVSPSESK